VTTVNRRTFRYVAGALLSGVLTVLISACSPKPAVSAAPAIGQWIWTRADLARFNESRGTQPKLEAAVFIGSIQCDTISRRLLVRAGLSVSEPQADAVTAVIRFENGIDRCRIAGEPAPQFAQRLDSAVSVLRQRARTAPIGAMQLDYDAPQRAIGAWAANVAYLHAHALRGDSIWVTSLIAQLREPGYGDLFRGVVSGHVLQVFDTGEPATTAQVHEALRLARRARMPFRLGLGAFERDTRGGRTEHRAWFATVAQFAAVDGFRGVWVFPSGNRWVSLLAEGT
jgi:hypothetical protein